MLIHIILRHFKETMKIRNNLLDINDGDQHLTLCILGNFACFPIVCNFFFLKKNNGFYNSLRNTIRVSNSLDCFVGPNLGPNCLHRLSAIKTSRLRVIMTLNINYTL